MSARANPAAWLPFILILGAVLVLSSVPLPGGAAGQGGDRPGPGPREDGVPWPMFRGGAARAGFSNAEAADNRGELLWSFKAGGPIYSSPAMGPDGTTYFGCSDDHVYAVDRRGALLWKFRTGGDVDASPLVREDGTILVGSDSLYALSPRGELRWKFPTTYGTTSSPVTAPDGTIYFGTTEGKVFGLAQNGTALYSFDAGQQVSSSPALDAFGNVYIGSYDGHLYCLRPDLTLKWSFRLGGFVGSTPAIAPNGTVYAGSRSGRFAAISPEGGLEWEVDMGRQVFSSAAVGPGGIILVGCDDSHLYALSPDGKVHWDFETGGWVDSSPSVAADGTIFFGSDDTWFYALFPNGTLKWKFKTDREVFSSPAIASNGSVVFGSWDGRLYCLGSTTSRPSPPRALTARLNGSGVDLRWEAPLSDGGRPLVTYRLQRGTAPGARTLLASVPPEAPMYRDEQVEGGRRYYYAVTAVNAVGESKPGNEANASVILHPMPPRSLAARAGDGFVQLDWAPPADDGGSPMTSYQVHCITQDGTAELLARTEPSAPTFTARGLTNGRTYIYQVTATNSAGESDPSNRVSATPLSSLGGPPSSPRDLRALSGNGTVDLSWTAPLDDGGHPLLGYRLYRERETEEARLLRNLTANDTGYRDASVENGRTYWYTVSAFNLMGEGAPSAAAGAWPFAHLRDPSPSVIRILWPKDGAVLRTARVQVRGEAQDVSGVLKVEVGRGGARWSVAEGNESWRCSITLSPGRNVIQVRVADWFGDLTTANTTVEYRVESTVASGQDPLLPFLVGVLLGVATCTFLLTARRRARR